MKYIFLILGGSIGTLSRHTLSGLIHRWAGAGFPYGTLVVNLAGCFVIGFLSAIPEKRLFLAPEIRLFLVAGFCGAFTTFSAFIFETDHLLKTGAIAHAVINIMVSVSLGFLVFRLGGFLGEIF